MPLLAMLWYAQYAALGWWLMVQAFADVSVEPGKKQVSTCLGKYIT